MHVGPLLPVGDLERSRTFYEDLLGGVGSFTPGGWQVTYDKGTVVYLLQLHEDGVHADERMQVSWFSDPDGNVLTLFRVATGSP